MIRVRSLRVVTTHTFDSFFFPPRVIYNRLTNLLVLCTLPLLPLHVTL